MYRDQLEKPLCYYATAFIIGIVAYCFYIENLLLLLVLPLIFLLVAFFVIDKSYALIMLMFFILGLICSIYYFNPRIDKNFVNQVRIERTYGNNAVVRFSGRTLKLYNVSGEKLLLNKNYIISGEYVKKIEVKDGVVGAVFLDKIVGGKEDFLSRVQDYKHNFYKKLASAIGERNSGLVVGLCLGDKAYIEERDINQFNEFGIIHIMCVSGFNLAIIFSLLKKIRGDWFALISVFFYTILSGANNATIRAFIMICVLTLSRKALKNYDGVSSISLAAIIILLFKPYEVIGAGFNLSFLATLGIILFNEKIDRYLYKIPSPIRESLALDFSAQVTTVPYMLMEFNNIAIGSVLANLVLVPVYSMIIVLGNLLIVLYFFTPAFNLVSYLIEMLFFSIRGIGHFLNIIMPRKLHGGYFEGISMLFIYSSFILFKRGYRSFKYLPVIICLIMIIRTYYFFPTFEVVQYKGTCGIIAKYKFSSELYLDYRIKSTKEEQAIKELMQVDMVKDNTEDGQLTIGDFKLQVESLKCISTDKFGEKKAIDLSLDSSTGEFCYKLSDDKNLTSKKESERLVILPDSYIEGYEYNPKIIYTITFLGGKVFLY